MVKSSIPMGIEREHVLQAVEDFKKEVGHEFGDSSMTSCLTASGSHPRRSSPRGQARKRTPAEAEGLQRR